MVVIAISPVIYTSGPFAVVLEAAHRGIREIWLHLH